MLVYNENDDFCLIFRPRLFSVVQFRQIKTLKGQENLRQQQFWLLSTWQTWTTLLNTPSSFPSLSFTFNHSHLHLHTLSYGHSLTLSLSQEHSLSHSRIVSGILKQVYFETRHLDTKKMKWRNKLPSHQSGFRTDLKARQNVLSQTCSSRFLDSNPWPPTSHGKTLPKASVGPRETKD